jgi:hypothetical protein
MVDVFVKQNKPGKKAKQDELNAEAEKLVRAGFIDG